MALALGLALALPFGQSAASPDQYAPFPAPAGFAWQFLTEDGVILTEDNIPLVSLEPLS